MTDGISDARNNKMLQRVSGLKNLMTLEFTYGFSVPVTKVVDDSTGIRTFVIDVTRQWFGKDNPGFKNDRYSATRRTTAPDLANSE